ncbi:cytochrome P450 [Aspergillus varians]
MVEFFVVFIMLCLKRLRGLWYLVRGPDIIDSAYLSSGGLPFTISTPSNDHFMITSIEHITEVVNAPLGSLSLHAVAKEIIQPKYTMLGFEWQDQRGVEGTGFVRALRSKLTAHLPVLLPDLQRIVQDAIALELDTPQDDGLVHCRLFPMIKRTVTKVNCFTFFGESLAQNSEFTAAALEFPQKVILAAEILRATPNFLRGTVARLATRRHHAVRTLMRYLEPVVEQRLAARAESQGLGMTPARTTTRLEVTPVRTTTLAKDLPGLTWTSQQWTTKRMVGEIIAVWFGSVHQLAMTTTYAIEDICLHDEYVQPLREEIHEHLIGPSPRGLAGMPLLDSFVRESIRCTNSDAITVRRKAITPFVFSDGLRVEQGDWVCVPQRAMMHDARRYENPDRFDGFRFVRANKQLVTGDHSVRVPEPSPLGLTDVSIDWPIWGLGNTACPGRFYAATILKLIMVCILERYECRLEDAGGRRSRWWRSSVVPREGTVVLFRRRR